MMRIEGGGMRVRYSLFKCNEKWLASRKRMIRESVSKWWHDSESEGQNNVRAVPHSIDEKWKTAYLFRFLFC